MTMLYSFENLIAAGPTVISAGADPQYPATNVRTPEAPFRPWKSLGLLDRSLFVDFGSAKALQLIQLIAANFTSAKLQGHTSDGSTYPTEVLADAPFGYWRLGEAPGTTVAVDSSGYGHNGVYTNGPILGSAGLLFSPDTVTGVAFTASLLQSVSIANVTALGSGHVLEAVVRPRINAVMSVLSRDSNRFLRFPVGGSVQFRWLDTGAVARTLLTASGLIVPGRIYHVVGRHDGTTTAEIYINGVVAATTSSFTSDAGSAGTWTIGYRGGGDPHYDGTIQEAALYGSSGGPIPNAARIAIHAGLVTPLYDQSVTIVRNVFNGRYQHSHVPPVTVPFNYRYFRLVIPSQAPPDGAVVYRLGGLWAGVIVKPPSNFRMAFNVRVRDPRVDVAPEHGGWRQRLTLGEPSVVLSTTRQARVNKLTPGLGDHLASWLDIDRQARSADIFAVYFNAGDPTQGYVMRRLNDVEWDRDRHRLMTSPYEIEEVIR